MVAEPQKMYSAAEYVALENEAEFKSELFNGQIYAMAGASPTHALITANVIGAVQQQLRGKPCRTFSSDLRVRVDETGAYVYPDVTIACPPLTFADDDANALTNPVVIVEVLSPSTEANDRGAKWNHYQHLPSLRDYVLVAQNQMRIEYYTRLDDGSWRYITIEKPDATLALDSIECKIQLAEIYERVEFINELGALATGLL